MVIIHYNLWKLSLILLSLCLLCINSVSAQYTAATVETIEQTCLLNQNTDLWQGIDCATYSSTYPINTNVMPGCIFAIYQSNLYSIYGDPDFQYSGCTFVDPQQIPLAITNLTTLSSLYLAGPQPALSGANLTFLNNLAPLSLHNASFTVSPIWPRTMNELIYYNQVEDLLTGVTANIINVNGITYTDTELVFNANIVEMSNCQFPNGANIEVNTAGVVLDELITLTYYFRLSFVTGKGMNISAVTVNALDITGLESLTVEALIIQLSSSNIDTVSLSGQSVVLADVITNNLTINDDVSVFQASNVAGYLSTLTFTDSLINLRITASPDLIGEVILPSSLAPLPAPDTILTGIVDGESIITITNTGLMGEISFPIGVTTVTITNNEFTGSVPLPVDYPNSLTFIDLRNNHLTLCTGYPAMGPQIPQIIAANNVLIYPQYADVTCYCATGNCLAGNGFTAHYQGTPAIYESLECLSESPSDHSYCLIGFWNILTNYTVNSGQTLTGGSGIAVQGDLTVQGSIVFPNGLLNSSQIIQVQGSFTCTGSCTIQIQFNDSALTAALNEQHTTNLSIPLVRTNGGITGSPTLDHIVASTGLALPCNKITGSSISTVDNTLVANFNIDGTGCKTPYKLSSGAIIGITVAIAIAVVVVVVIIALLSLYNNRCRRIVRPFTNRNEGPGPAHPSITRSAKESASNSPPESLNATPNISARSLNADRV